MSLNIPVYKTGIRDGETIVGLKPANKDTIIKIRGNYPVNVHTLQESYTDGTIFNKLELMPIFGGKSKDEIYQILGSHSTRNSDLYLNDTDIKIKFINIGGNAFKKKLTQDQINYLLRGNPDDEEGYWNISDVYNFIPPNKPGSRVKRHTLFFRPSIWSLSISCEMVNYGEGLIVSLKDGAIYTRYTNMDPNMSLYKINYNTDVFMNSPFYICANKHRDISLTMKSMKELVDQMTDTTDWNEIVNILSWFTPSVHKSLIQKIIRTGCTMVTYNNKKYNSTLMLLISFSILITSPGSFVPDIQRFVTGFESASKRLAVSIYEDSYTEYNNILLSMLGSALLIQHVNTWRPADDIIKYWLIVAIGAQKEKRMYDYSLSPFKSLTVIDYDYVTVSAMLLTEIKSFKSDIVMMNTIAANGGKPRQFITKDLIEDIPLIHCIDFHSLPDIAYIFDSTDLSYPELFSRIFGQVTGVNPRKKKYHEFILNDEALINEYHLKYEEMDFVKQTRKAQQRVWDIKVISKNGGKVKRNPIESEKSINFEYKLDESWIAGLIGPIEYPLNGSTAILTLRPDDIYKMVAIKKPSRINKDKNELTENENNYAIMEGWNMLKNGIQLTNVPNTLFWLKNAYIKYHQNKYYLYISNSSEWKTWDDICKTSISLPLLKSIDLTFENGINTNGLGIDQNAEEIFQIILKNSDESVLKRLLVHMIGFKSYIEMYKVNKQGKGTEYMVVNDDTAVFHFLTKLSILYPAALEIIDTSKFKVKYGPLFWSLRDRIQLHLYAREDSNYVRWNPVQDYTHRKLWEHQIDSVERMIQKNKLGKKGHLLWIPVRFGKTLIVLSYLKYLIDNGKMPMYCVYTLPSSAITSIESEIASFDFSYQIIDMTKASKLPNYLLPHHINLVKHDHMRLNGMDQQLKKFAPQMIFINDEFHKTLNQTKRTSIALEVARLSVDFIGLSGTIIQNNNINYLIKWLEQIVEFEVTENNFFVAIGSMISKKLHTRVRVDRFDIEAKFTDDERNNHKSLIPPAIGGTNTNPSMPSFRKAANLCWSVSTRKMVELTLNYIRHKERVMLVAKDNENQQEMKKMLIESGLEEKFIYCIGKNKTINLTYTDQRNYYCVITTHRYNAGYSLSKLGVMITGVYFNNQATREQLEGRINEPNQQRSSIHLLTVHCGLLTYTLKNHENVRSLSQAVKGYAEEIKI